MAIKFLEKFGGYSIFLIFLAALAWSAIFFMAPMGTISEEGIRQWDWWLTLVARNWPIVIVGCIAVAGFGAFMDAREEVIHGEE